MTGLYMLIPLSKGYLVRDSAGQMWYASNNGLTTEHHEYAYLENEGDEVREAYRQLELSRGIAAAFEDESKHPPKG